MYASEGKTIQDKDRPKCTCGVKMELVEYIGYYDNFKFWECEKCGDPHQFKADDTLRGAYA